MSGYDRLKEDLLARGLTKGSRRYERAKQGILNARQAEYERRRYTVECEHPGCRRGGRVIGPGQMDGLVLDDGTLVCRPCAQSHFDEPHRTYTRLTPIRDDDDDIVDVVAEDDQWSGDVVGRDVFVQSTTKRGSREIPRTITQVNVPAGALVEHDTWALWPVADDEKHRDPEEMWHEVVEAVEQGLHKCVECHDLVEKTGEWTTRPDHGRKWICPDCSSDC